jgi:hypothetical protein
LCVTDDRETSPQSRAHERDSHVVNKSVEGNPVRRLNADPRQLDLDDGVVLVLELGIGSLLVTDVVDAVIGERFHGPGCAARLMAEQDSGPSGSAAAATARHDRSGSPCPPPSLRAAGPAP